MATNQKPWTQRYFPIHEYRNGKFYGYMVKKNLSTGFSRDVAIIFQRSTLKKFLRIMNESEGG